MSTVKIEKAKQNIQKAIELFKEAAEEAKLLEQSEVTQWFRERKLQKARTNYKLTMGAIENILVVFDEYPISSTVNVLANLYGVDRTAITYQLRKFGRIQKGKRIKRK